MIETCYKKFDLYLSKLDLNQKYDDNYKLILQNQYSKEIFIIDLIDVWQNPIRYKFKVTLDDCMTYGTYEYYLINDNSFNLEELNQDIIKNSISCNDATIIINNKQYILFNGLILTDNSDECTGELFKSLSILNRGLLRYFEQEFKPNN